MKWEFLDTSSPSALQINEFKTYIRKKFTQWNGRLTRDATRKQKSYEVLVRTEGTPYEQIVKDAYVFVFRTSLPTEQVLMQYKATRPKIRGRQSAEDWESGQEAKLNQLRLKLETLLEWKEDQSYQEGARFHDNLRQFVSIVDRGIMESIVHDAEVTSTRGLQLDRSFESAEDGFEASVEGLLGMHQQASISFEAALRGSNWGVVSGKLEQSFRAGAWGRASAAAKLKDIREDLGLDLSFDAAIAIGAQLNIKGDLSWSKGDTSLTLGGEAELFAGARASASMTLSVSAREGLKAAISAGAFAGFKASCSGSCGLVVAGQEIFTLQAGASVSFGVGAEFSAELSCPIFGATTFSFSADVALGFGVGTEFEVALNFNEAMLASNASLKQLWNYRPVLQGYRLDLTNSDAKNLFYLNRAITRFGKEIASIESELNGYARTPEEQRSLLMDRD